MRKFIIFILTVVIFISCKSQPVPPVTRPPSPLVIDVKEPQFDVTSIFIIQADIVVTEFEAVIKIENPNSFALELSSITYELYGNGAFWASGTASDLLNIPANSSAETRFTFSMNFIDMSRPLLDDVIARRRVNYRFKGKAQVRPISQNVSAFIVDFDCTGLSEVRPK